VLGVDQRAGGWHAEDLVQHLHQIGFQRPRGVVLVICEGIYSATDPPLKALRRLLPPLRIGQVQLDLAFIVLFLIVTFAMALLDPR
jgi:hypothetical protein